MDLCLIKDRLFFFQMMGEDLIAVLDQLRIKCCIGIGDGAGANIIVRFGMKHVTRLVKVSGSRPLTLA